MLGLSPFASLCEISFFFFFFFLLNFAGAFPSLYGCLVTCGFNYYGALLYVGVDDVFFG